MVTRSVCPLDCPDRCSMTVEVDAGRVVKLDGSTDNPMTDGYICGKVRHFGDRVHGPRRLLTPMMRVGPRGPGARFEPLSWDDALDRVVGAFRAAIDEHGPAAILPYWYGGSNGMLTGGGLDQRLWNRLGATKILRTLCAANTGAGTRAVYGDLPSADPLDVDHANGIVLWGVNPSASGIHLVPRIRQRTRAGAWLAVVDPRRTPLAAQADLHLRPLPGTDVALALAIAHVAFDQGWHDDAFLAAHAPDAAAFREAVAPYTPERAAREAQVDPGALRELARRWHETRPTFLRAGWGLERTRNGSDAVRAVLSLPAIFGQFGVRGGGFCLSTSSGYRMDSSRWQGPPSGARTLNMSELGRILEEVADPPVKVLYVYDCNPVVTVPDQARVLRGLSRPDLFVVVHEQVHTDTCDYADIVLPATTFLEHEELTRSYGGYLLQYARPAIPPVGESWSNHRLAAALADRLGFGAEPAFQVTPEALAEEIASQVPGSWPALIETGIHELPRPVQFLDVFPKNGITLVGPNGPPQLRPPPADADLPLTLISPATTKAISSTGYETFPAGSAVVEIAPSDAAARGISSGDEVELRNSVGQLRCKATVTDAVRPGVVMVPKGLWRSASLDGFTSNALIPAHVDALGGGACYNDARVDIVRV